MGERDRYPRGVPCWVDTMGSDPERLMAFYHELFGWEFVGPGPMPGQPPGRYFVAQLRGRDVAGIGTLPAKGASAGGLWNTYIRVDRADDAAAAVGKAGGAVIVEPFDALPAGRMAVVADRDGASFCLWEPGERQGAQRVNEPGAWSMGSLHARDTKGAAAFYGAVFGWETEALTFDEARVDLFRLPGYVGGNPEQPVPRDVVAVMVPVQADEGVIAVAPHWGVDFWVSDTDGLTAKAAARGGKVIVPPHDAPGFRTAVLADPNGAVFSISELRLTR